MHITTFGSFLPRSTAHRNIPAIGNIAASHLGGILRFFFILILTFIALAFFFAWPVSPAQESKASGILPAASAGKAIVCIYRTYRFTGSAGQDRLFVWETASRKL